MDYKEIVADMLGVNDCGILHYDFLNYVDAVAQLTKRQGGKLVSRQVIALAIATWERMNPGQGIVSGG